MAKITIHREGSFLYQLDRAKGESGAKNVWSGGIYANNGYPHKDAESAAILMAASPDLLNAAEQALSDLQWIESQDSRNNFQSSILLLKHAIAKATGETK